MLNVEAEGRRSEQSQKDDRALTGRGENGSRVEGRLQGGYGCQGKEDALDGLATESSFKSLLCLLTVVGLG